MQHAWDLGLATPRPIFRIIKKHSGHQGACSKQRRNLHLPALPPSIVIGPAHIPHTKYGCYPVGIQAGSRTGSISIEPHGIAPFEAFLCLQVMYTRWAEAGSGTRRAHRSILFSLAGDIIELFNALSQ